MSILIVNPMVNPIVNRIVNPIVNPMVNNIVNCVVNPIVNPTVNNIPIWGLDQPTHSVLGFIWGGRLRDSLLDVLVVVSCVLGKSMIKNANLVILIQCEIYPVNPLIFVSAIRESVRKCSWTSRASHISITNLRIGHI